MKFFRLHVAVDDLAISKPDYSSGRLGDFRLMGDHHHGHAVVVEVGKNTENLLSRFGIQCACWFVR